MKNRLLAAAAALALMGGTAMASGPSPFSGTPLDYHIGEGSCVFALRSADLPGNFQFMGVPSDGQHAAQCDTIVAAFNAQRPIGWGVFPTSQAPTVPCDPHFCEGQSFAVRITHIVGLPLGFGQ